MSKKKWYDSAIIKEDESKVTEDSKHFILNNGTRKAIYSSNNIHYHDGEKWNEMNNSLKKVERGYEAKFGKYNACFSREDLGEKMEVSHEGRLVSWEYLGNSTTISKMKKDLNGIRNSKKRSKIKVQTRIPRSMNISTDGHVVYQNAEGNVDLDYRLTGNCIKEDIVIKEAADEYKYYFALKADGFTMKMSEDKRKIELYKTSELDNPEDRPEFVIPEPFMYDTIGNSSNDVHYEMDKIDDDTFMFVIEASSEWINSEDRVFPIRIDPQLVVDNNSCMSVSHESYMLKECYCNGIVESSYWELQEYPTYSGIYTYGSQYYKTTSTITINKSKIDLGNNKVISAKLHLTRINSFGKAHLKYKSSGAGDASEKMYNIDTSERNISLDITSIYNSTSDNVSVCLRNDPAYTWDIEYDCLVLASGFDYSVHFDSDFTLELEYEPTATSTERTPITIAEGAKVEMDVFTTHGTDVFEDISDPKLGVSINHVYKANDEFGEYGNNYRLNIDEKLEKTYTDGSSDYYVYIDDLGDKHTFDEVFYKISDSGVKETVSVSKEKITVDADGRLWYNNEEVFRELITNKGVKATATLEGFNDTEWLEQRSDEMKQMEEQKASYGKALKEFVLYNHGAKETLRAKDYLENAQDFETFINKVGGSQYPMTESELLSYKSMKISLNSLETQKNSMLENAENTAEQIDEAKKSVVTQRASLLLQKEEQSSSTSSTKEKMNELIGNVNDEENKVVSVNSGNTTLSNVPTQFALLKIQESSLTDQKNEAEETKNYETTTTSYSNCSASVRQLKDIDSQIANINEQISLIESKRDYYVETLKKYFKEYRNIINKIDKLEAQIPVRYIILGNAVKGFNEDGALVAIYDKHGNYLTFEREKYTSDGRTRISAITDKNGHRMNFVYSANDLLSEISNSIGQRTTFEYDTSGNLTKINRVHLPSLVITTGTYGITKVESSNGHYTQIALSAAGGIKSVTYYSKVSEIGNGTSTASTSDVKTITVINNTTTTTIKTDRIYQEIYKFALSTAKIESHYKLVNDLVTGAEKYTYTNDLLTKVVHAHKSCLNRYSSSVFDSIMKNGTIEKTTYNSFNQPIVVEHERYEDLGDGNGFVVIERLKSEYHYNDNEQLSDVRTVYSAYECGCSTREHVSITKYYYNAFGETVRTEKYIDGEQHTSGIVVEENVYDKNGNRVKSFKYNTLDSSSKFYEENEIAEDGTVLATRDVTGEHKTEFEFENDGSVRTKHLPNGSQLSYGRMSNGQVNAITHSTEEGEENSTNRNYNLGVLTRVKSGNNTVEYTYDEKRRVTSVSLNNKENYVAYSYIVDNNSNAQTTQSVMNGIVMTSVKNLHGMVTKTTCGGRAINYEYDTDNKLVKKIDNISGTTTYEYNADGQIETVKSYKNATESGCDTCCEDASEVYGYNGDKKLVLETLVYNGTARTYTYNYRNTAAQELSEITVGAINVEPSTDVNGRSIGRIVRVSGTKIAEEQISYLKFGDHATNMPSAIRYGNIVNGNFVLKDGIKYKYDAMGNITEIRENGNLVSRFTYDSIGRLVREDNKPLGNTITFVYDNCGNIVSKIIYAFTLENKEALDELSCFALEYAYDSGSDKLMSYNGESFEYDEIGNPKVYRGKNATWSYGRQLQSYDGNTYTYDASGRRLTKRHGTDDIIHFTYDSNGRLIHQSNGLEFIYDHTGVMGVICNGSTYFYRKNAQNDIISLLDNQGNVVVKYIYDGWGNHSVNVLDESAAVIANLNPFRYRSYYYDVETGLYFLKTRYYDPEIGRFMTIDGIAYLNPDSINGLNLYAYCGNNPVMRLDPNGTEWWNLTTWDWGAIGRFVGGTALAIAGAAFTIATLPTAISQIGGGVLTQLGFSAMMYGGFMVASVFDSEIKSDMDAIGWNPFNTDTSIITTKDSLGNIRKVSFYKGVPVIRFKHEFLTSFSFLGIFLNNENGVDDSTLNHEYGHNMQQMFLGPLKYLLGIAAPSALFNFASRNNKPLESLYCSMPWERTAELFGDVISDPETPYVPYSAEVSLLYFLFLMLI